MDWRGCQNVIFTQDDPVAGSCKYHYIFFNLLVFVVHFNTHVIYFNILFKLSIYCCQLFCVFGTYVGDMPPPLDEDMVEV